LLPYKNVRSVVAAYAEEPGRRLIVVGRGPEEAALRQLATDNVLFLQNISDEQLAWLYRSCTALIAISFEDFGLTPLEAASFGKPSIVLRWGGFLETQIEGVTATFVDEPTPQAVREGLQAFDGQSWDADAIRAHADEFNEEVFVRNIRAQVARIGALAGPSSDPASGTEPEGS
jgi:glycosyltransferase involved in cell wall biosynthesis